MNYVKQIFCIVLLFTYSYSQSFSFESETSGLITADSSEFDWRNMYPLNDGDLWVYEYSLTSFYTDIKTVIVEKDTLINGHL